MPAKATNHLTLQDADYLKTKFFGRICPGCELIAYRLQAFVAVDEITAVFKTKESIDSVAAYHIAIKAKRSVTRGTSVSVSICIDRFESIDFGKMLFSDVLKSSGDLLKLDLEDEFTATCIDGIKDAVHQDCVKFLGGDHTYAYDSDHLG